MSSLLYCTGRTVHAGEKLLHELYFVPVLIDNSMGRSIRDKPFGIQTEKQKIKTEEEYKKINRQI